MVRIAGVDLQDNKKIQFALTDIYGIGKAKALSLIKQAKVDAAKRARELKEEEIVRIQKIIEKGFVIEGDLRREIDENIKRLKTIGAYRGLRHSRGLPVRGQRTRSNARTKRGKRKTVGALKKEQRAKTEQTDKQE